MLHIAKNLEYGIARNRNVSTAKQIVLLLLKVKENQMNIIQIYVNRFFVIKKGSRNKKIIEHVKKSFFFLHFRHQI